MGTFTGSRVASTIPVRYNAPGITGEVGTYVCPTAISAGDIIQMVKVPKGAMVVDLKVQLGQSSWSFSVGDGDDTGRYVLTASNSGAITVMNSQAGLGYSYSAADTIDIVHNAGLATGTKTMTLAVLYKMDQAG